MKVSLIEEYKLLREEIVRLEKEILLITFYVFSITLIASGLSVKNNTYIDIVPIIYQIILVWGINRFITSSRLRMRLSTYNQVFIEPNIDVLNWERRNMKFKDNKGVIINKWIKRIGSLFFLLTLLGIYVTYNFVINTDLCKTINLILLISILLLQLLNFYLVRIGVFLYPKQKNYIKKWENIKKQEIENIEK